MLWPFPGFLFTLRTQQPGEAPRYTIFPSETAHSSWIELAMYLGKDFRPDWLISDDRVIHAEFHACGNADAFYHTSQRYLYHLVAYYLEGWKRAGMAFLFDILAHDPTQTVLDYGCGVGEDGLWLLENNIKVHFADFDNPCSRYLAWRLAHRLNATGVRLYDLDTDTIPHHDIVWCMDVLEHLPASGHIPFLLKLGALGRVVICNLVDDKTADGTVHHPVDVDGLTALVDGLGPMAFKDMYEKEDGSKVRFLMYRLQEEA